MENAQKDSQQPAQQAQSTPPMSPTPPFKQLPFKQPSQGTTFILVGVFVLLVSGMLTYVIVAPSKKTLVAPAALNPFSPPKPTLSSSEVNPSPSPTVVPTIPTTSWKTYTNSTYGYSIKYPSDWTARNLGALEPLIPSYVVFNPTSASQSARNITVSISTRTYAAQLALAASGSATTVADIVGSRQSFQDSNGATSTVVTLPRTSNLLVIRGKTAYLPIFNQMLTTLQTTK